MELFITDKCMGLVDAVEEYFPSSYWQRCIVHFYRNVFLSCPLSPDAGNFCDAQGHTFPGGSLLEVRKKALSVALETAVR